MITYVSGDATRPTIPGKKLICHICNDCGGWGRGFVLAISRRWKEPEAEFRKTRNPSLGKVQFIQVEDDIVVANMVAQHGIRGQGKGPPIRYDAVRTCLMKVAEFASVSNPSIHLPRIGCGLAGGKWKYIEPIIKETMPDLQVYVYDLP